jgi:polyhydroxyalkanoate synthase subunit PhaC
MKRLANLLGLAWRKPPPLGATPADVVHTENKWRLLRYRHRKEGLAFGTPVLMVPSLINRHYVLDLTPGKSMVEFLVEQGHDVYVIDWGTPAAEDRYLDFDTICGTYLGRAVRIAARGSDRGKVHLLGYCLGGTLTTIYAAAFPERVASLIALAAPVAFAAGGRLTQWVRSPSFDIDALVDGAGNVPSRLMQASFHMIKPTLNLSKAVTVVDRAWNDEFLDGFLALEAWGSDNVSFPGECYRTWVGELYQRDALATGDFVLCGRPADPRSITCPVLAITFADDYIVPEASAAPLIDWVASVDKHRVHQRGGHVGAVVSRKARQGLWPFVSGFWAMRDECGTLAPRDRRTSHSPGPELAADRATG